MYMPSPRFTLPKLRLPPLLVMSVSLIIIFLETCQLALAKTPPHTPSSPPVPKSKTTAIKTFEDRLKNEELRKKKLEQKALNENKKIKQIKNKLMIIAASMRKNENERIALEDRIKELENKENIIRSNLNGERLSISHLILALERIRRTPPEAMLAKPDIPYKTAQSALLMSDIIVNLKQEAQKLKKNLDDLNKVTSELKERREKLLKIADRLQNQYSEISALMKKREKLYKQTNKDIRIRELEIQKLSLQAGNLEELVKKLELQEKRKKARDLSRLAISRGQAAKPKIITKAKPHNSGNDSAGSSDNRNKIASIPSKSGLGSAQLPVSGIIRVPYRGKDDMGALSNGLTIECRPGSIALAPISGKIQFAGAFKRYGNMIIIEHANGYHSLIAGLQKVDTIVGQYVSTGEPIGVMPKTTGKKRPRLYYELRYHGQPVNPSILFSGLG